MAEVFMGPFHVRCCLAAGGNHLGRALDTRHRRVGPALLDELGDIAGAGAEIGNRTRTRIRNSHQQVDGGPEPVAGEFQILLRIPDHRSAPFLFSCFLQRGSWLPLLVPVGQITLTWTGQETNNKPTATSKSKQESV
ncbi:hypothetical protein ACVWWP_006359 [Bradyrhizobium sp. LM3.6]